MFFSKQDILSLKYTSDKDDIKFYI